MAIQASVNFSENVASKSHVVDETEDLTYLFVVTKLMNFMAIEVALTFKNIWNYAFFDSNGHFYSQKDELLRIKKL